MGKVTDLVALCSKNESLNPWDSFTKARYHDKITLIRRSIRPKPRQAKEVPICIHQDAEWISEQYFRTRRGLEHEAEQLNTHLKEMVRIAQETREEKGQNREEFEVFKAQLEDKQLATVALKQLFTNYGGLQA